MKKENSKRSKIAYLVSHPIQYQSPMLKYISEKLEADLEVLFLSNMSVKGYRDIEFDYDIKWDTPLLSGFHYKFLRALGPQKNSFLFPICLDIYSILKHSEYDYVWVHGWGSLTNILAIIFANKLGIKVLIRGESNLLLPKGFRLKQKIKSIFLRWLFKKIDYYLAIGSLNKKFYEFYGVNNDRIIMVPYAVDNHYFQQQSKKYRAGMNEFKKLNSIDDGSKIILYASKLTNRKNSIDLLLAYEKLLFLFPENMPYLVFVGSGEMNVTLSQLIEKKNLNKVKILGFKNQSQLPEYYECCDIFVLPSSAEPWGLVVNEVMNHSKPIIVSDEVGCAVDLVDDGVNGFIFKCGDIDDLSKKIKLILNDDEMRLEASSNSLKKINSWGFEEDLIGFKKILFGL